MNASYKIFSHSLGLILCGLIVGLGATNAHAVITKNCPETISMNLVRTTLGTDQQIRELPRHVKYDEEKFDTVFESRNRIEELFSTQWQSGDFVLVDKKSGKCIYKAEDKSIVANWVTLFSTGGKDYLKQEFSFLQRIRDEERFAILSEISSYSTDGIELNRSVDSQVFTTVNYACYDRVCQAEALIGTAEIEMGSNF